MARRRQNTASLQHNRFRCLLFLLGAGAAAIGAAPRTASGVRAPRIYTALPPAFEPNRGQADPGVDFVSHGTQYSVFLAPDQSILQFPAGSAAAAVHIRFAGAARRAPFEAFDRQPGVSNYLIGSDPSRWHTEIPHYGRVRYRNVYPGIDVVYHGDQEQLEYDFVLAGNADPARIRVRIEGSERIVIDPDGDLIIEAGGLRIRQRRPVVYQDGAGRRQPVDGRYVIRGANEVGFRIAQYDKRRPLVIDPVLVFSSFLGGSGNESGYGIALDSAQNAYISGTTGSTNFPVTGAFQPVGGGGTDVFVAKISAGGTLVYATYLGGAANDAGSSIAVDGSGNAYVTGQTYSTNFPVVNALQPAFGGSSDAFIAELNSAGNGIVYSTYLGGSGDEYGFGIAVDAGGNTLVSGYTASLNFPLAHAIQTANNGGNDAFAAKIAPGGSALVYATYIGGSGNDYANNLAVDTNGNAYLLGDTASTNFPVLNALQPLYGGGTTDGFITKLAPDGSLLYSTYLGGSANDAVRNGKTDAAGNLYITGGTGSTNFPLANPIQSVNAGGAKDGFVCKIDPAGAGLLYSTYLGGSGEDDPNALALDSLGNVYIAGYTQSTDFPVVRAIQGANAGGWDGFVTKINAAGTAVVFSTYLGGSGLDQAYKVAADNAGNAYVTGTTQSTNFPIVLPFQAAFGGGTSDVFVTRIATCDYPLSPANAVFDSSGGSGSIGIGTTADCAWAAATNAAWVALQAPASGVGAGNLAYSVAPNTTGAALSGSITVGTQTFTVAQSGSPVTLSSISPATGATGNNISVTLTGTNFSSGAVVNAGAGITVGNVTVVSATQITANFTIAPGAPLGLAPITVTAAAGLSNALSFNVTAGFTPIRINAGVSTSYTDQLGQVWGPDSGYNTGGFAVFSNPISGASAPALYQSGHYGNGPGGTPLIYQFAVPNGGYTVNLKFADSINSQPGKRLFNVSINGQTVLSNFDIVAQSGGQARAVDEAFAVNVTGGQIAIQFTGVVSNPRICAIEIIGGTAPAPVVSQISPATGAAGASVPVTVTGSNLNTNVVMNAGPSVTISNIALVSATQATATLAIAASAPAGATNFGLTTIGGAATPLPFTITSSVPSVSSISPASGVQGASVPVTLTGSNFIAGATVNAGGGITVSNVTVVSATQITATFAIAANAALGAANVTVTTSGGTSNAVSFTVNPPAPTLASVSPASGVQGTSVPITLTGTNFVSGATVAVSASGATVSGVTVVSATQITATIGLASNAALGPANVTVTTAGGTTSAVTFTTNPPAPTLTAITPGSGAQGASVPVTLTGSNFIAGATVNAGSGITVSNVTVVSATQITANFAIAANAALGAANVTVTTSGGTSNAVSFTVNPPAPTLASVSPASGVQGTSVPITLTGTNFVSSATVAVSASGATVSGVTVVSATQITATIALASNAALGAANVTVTTSGGTTSAVTFTINPPAPTLTAITPGSGAQGASVPVTLTGSNFVSGATVNAGSGITVSNVTVVSATQITATFAIAANAALGAANVTVTTSGGTATPATFTINPPPPTLASIGPASGVQGASVPVTLTGTNFVSGATVAVNNAGVTVSGVTVVSSTQITATFAVAANAALGAANVTVTTSGGTTSAATFTINPPAPTLTSISPASGVQGTSVPITLTGTNFVSGATVAVSASGATVTGVTVVSATQITATIALAPNAAVGPANVTVTTAGGTTSAVTFTINPPAPTLAAINPSSGAQGASVPVTLTGSNFVSGATVTSASPDITVTNVTFVSATQITATFVMSATASLAPDGITVSTSGGTSGAMSFTVNPPPPTLTSISPASGVQGASVPVTLTGTNFVSGATVAVNNAGVTVSGVTVVSSTQITATFAVAANAALGAANVTVTTSGGTTSAATFTVNPPAPTLTSINPASGAQGTSVPITLTGTNFVSGATVAVSASGATVSGATVVSATQITATIALAPNAAVGPANVTVTTAGGTTSAVMFTINPPAPTLTAISPGSGAQGASVPVTLTGSNFVSGATVNSGSPDITVNSVSVVSATQITATLAIAPTAALGAANITVTTAGGTSGAVSFTVNPPAPTLTSISPAAGVQGASVPVTLTGTNFVSGATVGVSSAGVTVSGITVASPTQITATFNLAANAALGPANVTVTTAGGTTAAVPFTVNPAAPTLTSISPAGGAQGASVPVTLSGTNFVSGASVATDNPGISVGNVVVTSATQITASLAIASSAATGIANVTVTTSGGTSSPVAFTVNPPAPVLSSISPASGVTGTSVPVTLTGANFVAGAAVNVNAAGVTVSGVSVVSASQLTATFSIAANAALGAANVTVVTAGGTSGPVTFTINPPAPVLTSISPASGVAGSSVPVTLSGSNFVAGAAVAVAASGASVTNVSVVSTNQINATLVMAAGATAGPANVTVTTSGGTSAPVSFTINPPAPGLSAISPAAGSPGSSFPVTLTGTNFLAGAAVAITSPDVAVSNVSVVNSSQITATSTVAANAAPGAFSVTVTTSGGTSGGAAFTINPPPPVLSSITPASAGAGSAVAVTLSGSNFTAGASVNVSYAGITVTNVAVASASQITATFNVAANAVPGTASVTVTTAGGTSGAAAFTIVAPAFTPIRVNAGASTSYTDPLGLVWSADTGYNNGGAAVFTPPISGTSAPALYQSGHWGNPPGSPPTIYQFAVPNGNYTVNLKFADSYYSQPGQRVFNVLLNGVTVLSNFDIIAQSGGQARAVDTAFPVSVTGGQIAIEFDAIVSNPRICAIEIIGGAAPAPAVNSISPSTGAPGTSVPVTLTGTNLGSNVVINAGPSITATNVSVVSATQVNATLNIAANAAQGNANVNLTTIGGAAAPVAFNVFAPPPNLTSITPSSGIPGSAVNVTLAGSNLAAATVSIAGGAGIAVSNVSSTASQVTATFTIASNAVLGAYNVSVTTPGGASNAVAFSVIAPPAPALTSIAPSSGTAGTSLNVTLAGSNLTGAAVGISGGSGVSVSNVSSTATQVTATFTMAGNATTGAYNVTVTTAGDTSNAVAFTVNPFTAIRVNAGSTSSYTDPLGQVWSADTGYNNGGLNSSTAAISGTPVPALYQTGHWGASPGGAPLVYQFAVPNGSYTVNLKYTDPLYTQPGQRVFNVAINGQTVASNFDIVAQSGGQARAVDTAFPVTVANGQIAIQFTAVVSNPRVSAIEIVAGTPGTPTLSSIAPAAGTHGSTVSVVLTGTNLGSDVVVNAVPGITVSNVTVVSATQVNATFAIASTAAAGNTNVTLTGPGGTSGPVAFAIQ